jgi:tetratricopeptide (TPR) repeat protein
VAFLGDGSRLLSAEGGGVLILRQTAGGRELRRAVFPGEPLNLYVSRDEREVTIWCRDGNRHLFTLPELQSTEALATADLGGEIGATAMSGDGRLLAVGHADGTVALWDAQKPGRLLNFPALSGAVYALAFEPDGTRLAVAGVEANVTLWDVGDIRARLVALGLDWDMPALTSRVATLETGPAPMKIVKAPPPPAPARPGLSKDQIAVIQYSLALALQPLNPEAYFRRGSAYYGMNRWREAEDDFSRSLALRPGHGQALHLRGHVHEHLDDPARAIADFGASIANPPANPSDHAHLYQVRGVNLLRVQQYEAGIRDLERSLALDSGHGPALDRLAWIYVAGPAERRQPDRALTLIQQAVALPNALPSYQITLGLVCYRLGKWSQATAVLEALTQTQQREPGGLEWLLLALCHQRLGDAARARDCYGRGQQWWEANRAKLLTWQREEIDALRVEAENLLQTPNPTSK